MRAPRRPAGRRRPADERRHRRRYANCVRPRYEPLGPVRGTRAVARARDEPSQVRCDRAPRSRLLQSAVGGEVRAPAGPAAARGDFARARPGLRAGRARAPHHRALRLDRDRARPLAVHARRRARAGRVDRCARPAAPRRHRHPRLSSRSRDLSPVGDAGRRRHRRRHGRHLPAAARLDAFRGLRPRRHRLLEEEAPGRVHRASRRTRARTPRPPRQRAGGHRRGLVPMHAVTATQDEWDEYEWKFCPLGRAPRPRAAGRPGRTRDARPRGRWRDAYLKWGREALGFAAYLFYRPGTRNG